MLEGTRNGLFHHHPELPHKEQTSQYAAVLVKIQTVHLKIKVVCLVQQSTTLGDAFQPSLLPISSVASSRQTFAVRSQRESEETRCHNYTEN